MTGHQKFSNLTKDFSPERKAKIAEKKALLKQESYQLVSLELNNKIVDWAKKEAEKQGVSYDVIINNELLKLCS